VTQLVTSATNDCFAFFGRFLDSVDRSKDDVTSLEIILASWQRMREDGLFSSEIPIRNLWFRATDPPKRRPVSQNVIDEYHARGFGAEQTNQVHPADQFVSNGQSGNDPPGRKTGARERRRIGN
jgi:hypothetical protein